MKKEGWYHTILRVTLKNSEQYAVDLTGAQYGHYQECLPWQDYCTARVGEIIEVNSYGYTKQLIPKEAKKRGYLSEKTESLSLSFAKELRLCIEHWKSHGETFDTLLASPEVEYQQKKKALLELVKKLMKLSREISIQQGSWCFK